MVPTNQWFYAMASYFETKSVPISTSSGNLTKDRFSQPIKLQKKRWVVVETRMQR
jgi:hypothetical protein